MLADAPEVEVKALFEWLKELRPFSEYKQLEYGVQIFI
jgi:hypothetical protein